MNRRGRKTHLSTRRPHPGREISDSERFDVLWRGLPFQIRHHFGGDAREARVGVDAWIAQGCPRLPFRVTETNLKIV